MRHQRHALADAAFWAGLLRILVYTDKPGHFAAMGTVRGPRLRLSHAQHMSRPRVWPRPFVTPLPHKCLIVHIITVLCRFQERPGFRCH